MKGIAHFATGVAVASCFPQAVQAGADGNPLPLVLGGVFGLLPDTLDFKFSRFFYRHDVEVTPDPRAPDPKMIAQAVAHTVNRAFETGRPVRIKLNTIRLAADEWRRYEVKFDVPRRRVTVRLGLVVATSGAPRPGSEAGTGAEASAPLACDVKLDYRATTIVDAFEGPLFTMQPRPDGCVIPRFIPWHRAWSHSLVVGTAWGLVAAAIWQPYVGLIVAGAWIVHVVADQLGFMGSNLWFPFRVSRTGGMQLAESGSATANFLTVWLSCVLIFWNLFRNMPCGLPGWNRLNVLMWGGVAPALLALAVRRALRRKRE